MATAPSPNDLTRQQLDELDALLQRMLSVPLAPAETPMPAAPTAPAPLPPSWRVDPPSPAPVPAPHLLLTEPPAPAPKVEEPPAPAKPQTPPPPPPAKPQAAPMPAQPAKVAPAPLPRPAASTSQPVTPVPAAPPLPLLILPFVALSVLFNSICGLFGPPGRLLRSGFFKHIYGLIGLGLLLYTAAHVAQVNGWLSLPVSLPWPH